MADDLDLYGVFDDVDMDAIDTSKVGGSFELLPDGEYLVQAVDGKIDKKDNGNVGMKLTFEVMSGPHEGRKIFEYFNIRHTSVEAQRIALELLTTLWRDALGNTGAPANAEQLMFKPALAKVGKQKRKDGEGFDNRIRRFMSANGGQAPQAKAAPSQAARPAQSAPAQQSKQTASRAPDWMKSRTAA